jgi:hypothetical protein
MIGILRINKIFIFSLISVTSDELNKNQKLNKFSMIKLNPNLINKYFSPEIKQHEIDNIIDMRYVCQRNICGDLCASTTII